MCFPERINKFCYKWGYMTTNILYLFAVYCTCTMWAAYWCFNVASLGQLQYWSCGCMDFARGINMLKPGMPKLQYLCEVTELVRKQCRCVYVYTVVSPLRNCSLDRHSVIFIYNEVDAFITIEWPKLKRCNSQI